MDLDHKNHRQYCLYEPVSRKLYHKNNYFLKLHIKGFKRNRNRCTVLKAVKNKSDKNRESAITILTYYWIMETRKSNLGGHYMLFVIYRMFVMR